MEDKASFLVYLRVGTLRGSLRLCRSPKFLRFVMVGGDWETLDALDQLDDTPKPEETVLAAALRETGTVHIDFTRNGRRCGEWLKTATYALVEKQPAQDVLRDTSAWRAWCVAQEAESKVVP